MTCWYMFVGFNNGCIISSLPEQNGRHFADDIFRCIFMNEKSGIFVKVSFNFFPKGPIDNWPNIGLE